MSATFTIAALLTLQDKLSAPLRAAQRSVAGLGEQMRGLQGVAHRVSTSLRGVSEAATRLGTLSAQVAALAQLGTGFGIENYIRNTISVEHRLAALGNTAGLTSDQLQAIHTRLTEASRATNQFRSDLLTANEQLIAAGMEWQKALDITPVLGKVATATQANMGDLAQTAYALSSNLRIPVEQMQAALERLTVAGQSGQFELKDMAREFAKLGASMGALKFTGLENVSRLGAALQIARRGAGDASEAANNLQNFLAKLAAPEVQRNFQKFGIDLPRLLKGARERGLDPFLVTLKAIKKATGGDEFKLGELFGDMQVQNFIKPMLLYTEDYKQLVQEINQANGVIEANFGRMMTTTAERWKQFRIQLETTPMPWLDDLIQTLSSLMEKMNEYPGVAGAVAKGLVGIAVAAVGLKAAAVVIGGLGSAIGGIGKVLGSRGKKGAGIGAGEAATEALGSLFPDVQKVYVVNMPNLGGMGLPGPERGTGGAGGAAGKAGGAARTLGERLRSLATGVWTKLQVAWQALAAWGGKIIAIAGRVGSAIASAGATAGRAILWLGRVMLTTPVGLILTGIATAAYLVWSHWDTIGPRLAAVWQSVKQTFHDAWQAIVEGAQNLWQKVRMAFDDGVSALTHLAGRMRDMGAQIIEGLVAGIRQRWAALRESVSGMAGSISGWVKDTLGIRSPSRVFAEIGTHLMGGLQQGIERAATLPLSAMRGVAAALAAPITAGAIALAPMAQAVEPVVLPEPMDAVRTIRQAVEPITLPEPMDAVRTIRQAVEPMVLPEPGDALRTIRQAVEPMVLPEPMDALRTIRQAVEPIMLPEPTDALRTIRQAVEPMVLPEPMDALRTIRQAVEPIMLPEPMDALRTIRDVLEPVGRPTPIDGLRATPPPGMVGGALPDIHVTVNLNGPATPESAQQIAAAVRREIDRILAEQTRRDKIARRARLIDGGAL